MRAYRKVARLNYRSKQRILCLIMEIIGIVFHVIKCTCNYTLYKLYKLCNIKLFFNVFMDSTYGAKYVFTKCFKTVDISLQKNSVQL